jgi:hypothetical protein
MQRDSRVIYTYRVPVFVQVSTHQTMSVLWRLSSIAIAPAEMFWPG